MIGFAAFLVGMVGPIAARWIASMGLTLIALTGATLAFTTLKDNVTTYIGGMPSDALAIGGLMGLWEGLGIILGALAFALTWASTNGFWTLGRA